MIANDRTHHPSCAARNGGLCTGCPTSETKRVTVPAAVHLSCRVCGEEYVALGITDEIRDRAAAAGPTCCLPIPSPSATSTSDGEPVEGGVIFTGPTAARQAAVVGILLGLVAAFWLTLLVGAR